MCSARVSDRGSVASAALADRTVLVTGANRGLGQALVEEALRRGAERVYAGTRRPLVHPDPRVTALALDVTDAEQVRRAADQVQTLDILVNNAGLAQYDDLSDRAIVEQHLAVNLFGIHAVTEAFRPLLIRSHGAVVNVLSVAALASLPFIPSYSLSKAAALSLSQSQRAPLRSSGVRVHAVLSGPVDTDMSRDLAVPKADPGVVARAIFDGVQNGEEEIFPDLLSASLADDWRSGPVKILERENAAFLGRDDDFTTSFTVDRTPEQVFAAINDVRGWWSGDVEGSTDELGAEFTYRYEDLHRSRQRVVELAPGRRVVWQVVDGQLGFTQDAGEWSGTDIVFDICPQDGGTQVRFTHVGLVPQRECFETCSNAWNHYVNGSLRRRILTGAAQHAPVDEVG